MLSQKDFQKQHCPAEKSLEKKDRQHKKGFLLPKVFHPVLHQLEHARLLTKVSRALPMFELDH